MTIIVLCDSPCRNHSNPLKCFSRYCWAAVEILSLIGSLSVVAQSLPENFIYIAADMLSSKHKASSLFESLHGAFVCLRAMSGYSSLNFGRDLLSSYLLSSVFISTMIVLEASIFFILDGSTTSDYWRVTACFVRTHSCCANRIR